MNVYFRALPCERRAMIDTLAGLVALIGFLLCTAHGSTVSVTVAMNVVGLSLMIAAASIVMRRKRV